MCNHRPVDTRHRGLTPCRDCGLPTDAPPTLCGACAVARLSELVARVLPDHDHTRWVVRRAREVTGGPTPWLCHTRTILGVDDV